MEHVTLSNGVKMPILGYGVYQVTKDECERCVLDALKVGYRAIDTAQSYFNEEEVGNAIAKSGIPREEIFLTTKVWIEHYGYEEAKKSVIESMKKLKTDYLDLVLLHQPFSDAYGAYHALEDLYDEGKIRAIGISNFYVDRMIDFASFNRIKPMVNQVETHQVTGGDLFEIEPTEPYTEDDLNWTNDNSRVSKEHEDESLRDVDLVSTTVDGWDSYDTVYIGYPIWWGIAAWPVNNFVKDNDFTGKTVIPFCTAASSGIGDSGNLLQEMAGTGDWKDGERFRGNASESDISSWIDGLGLEN